MPKKHLRQNSSFRIGLTAFVACAMAIACAGTSDRWTGSIDAVFRYRANDHSTVIHQVRPGSYSDKAGLKQGDVVLAVDGKDVTTAGYEILRAALRGPVGTEAKITVQRGDKILDFKIERRPVRDSSSSSEKQESE